MLQSAAICFSLVGTVLSLFSSVRIVCGSNDQWSVFRGHFVHPDYGFSVVIPKGLAGYPYPAGYPFHGIRISDESAKNGWYIVVEAHYYDPDISDPLDSEWKIQKNFVESQGGRALDPPQKARWREFPALRFRFLLKNPHPGGKKIEEEGIIISRKELNTLYSISMTADERQRKEASLVLEKIKNSFTLLSVK